MAPFSAPLGLLLTHIFCFFWHLLVFLWYRPKLGSKLHKTVDLADGTPKWVHFGSVEWSLKWCQHGWCTPSGPVGHRDLWGQILSDWNRSGVCVGGGGAGFLF